MQPVAHSRYQWKQLALILLAAVITAISAFSRRSLCQSLSRKNLMLWVKAVGFQLLLCTIYKDASGRLAVQCKQLERVWSSLLF